MITRLCLGTSGLKYRIQEVETMLAGLGGTNRKQGTGKEERNKGREKE